MILHLLQIVYSRNEIRSIYGTGGYNVEAGMIPSIWDSYYYSRYRGSFGSNFFRSMIGDWNMPKYTFKSDVIVSEPTTTPITDRRKRKAAKKARKG